MTRQEALERIQAQYGNRATAWRRGANYYAGFFSFTGMRNNRRQTTWHWIAKSYAELVEKVRQSALTRKYSDILKEQERPAQATAFQREAVAAALERLRTDDSSPLDTHTPGPWHWHDASGRRDGQGEAIKKDGLGNGPPVGQCSPFSFAVSDDSGFVVARCSNALVTMEGARSEANARLCAAAPDMLNALELALPALEQGREYYGEVLQVAAAVREAIQKAQGKL